MTFSALPQSGADSTTNADLAIEPWKWGTCFGGVRVSTAGLMSTINRAASQLPGGTTARALIEHYLLVQLLVGAGSGMGAAA